MFHDGGAKQTKISFIIEVSLFRKAVHLTQESEEILFLIKPPWPTNNIDRLLWWLEVLNEGSHGNSAFLGLVLQVSVLSKEVVVHIIGPFFLATNNLRDLSASELPDILACPMMEKNLTESEFPENMGWKDSVLELQCLLDRSTMSAP